MGTKKFIGVHQLTYDQALKEIQTGDILFGSGDYLVSQLIKKASNSMFSHVGMLCHWNDRVVIFESVEDDGVRAVPLSHYLFNHENSNQRYVGKLYVGRHETLNDPNFEKGKLPRLVGKAIDLLNRSYDKNGIAEIVARIGLGIGRNKNDEQYICSEFVDECFRQIHIKFPRDPKGFIYPEHIADDANVKPLFEIF